MKILKLLIVILIMSSCSKYPGVPKSYNKILDHAIERADSNSTQLMSALKDAPKNHKEAMAFLISYMPERDLKTLNADFLIKNVDLAYQAKNKFSWAKNIPDSVFFNDVLPYVIMNETRDDWRADFFSRFTKYVEKCDNITDAITNLNKNIRDELKVDYNTKREKPDQSPTESLRQSMASCSGLSILLCDAFRSVGIPSRVAGTANWHDNRGNHNWCEVWIDGQWYFTEYYPDQLNKSWFLNDAGKADANDKNHAIFATSFKTTDQTFPLVWDLTIDYVPAINVTDRYVKLYNANAERLMNDGKHVVLSVHAYKNGKTTGASADRLATNVDIFCGSEQIGGGRTAGSNQDLNDVLNFHVVKNKTYTLKYCDENGKNVQRNVDVKDKDCTVSL